MLLIVLRSGPMHCFVLTSRYQSYAPCGWWKLVGKAGHCQAHSSCGSVEIHEVIPCFFAVKHIFHVFGTVDIRICYNAFACGRTWCCLPSLHRWLYPSCVCRLSSIQVDVTFGLEMWSLGLVFCVTYDSSSCGVDDMFMGGTCCLLFCL